MTEVNTSIFSDAQNKAHCALLSDAAIIEISQDSSGQKELRINGVSFASTPTYTEAANHLIALVNYC
jgi:hypothetical protein